MRLDNTRRSGAAIQQASPLGRVGRSGILIDRLEEAKPQCVVHLHRETDDWVGEYLILQRLFLVSDTGVSIKMRQKTLKIPSIAGSNQFPYFVDQFLFDLKKPLPTRRNPSGHRPLGC